jgi:Protein of unknown function (DUF3631)
MEGRPWAEYSRGRPLTKNKLPKLLKPFGITPITIRSNTTTKKGYHLNRFNDAFSRYMPLKTPQRHNVDGARVSGDFENVTKPSCDEIKNGLKASKEVGCDDVTFRKAGFGGNDINNERDNDGNEFVSVPV